MLVVHPVYLEAVMVGDYSDCECTCWCCGYDLPVQSQPAMHLVGLSTMAFVAMQVIEEEDADTGMTLCPMCAERCIGPAWRSLGQWKANQYQAEAQVDDMLRGDTMGRTRH